MNSNPRLQEAFPLTEDGAGAKPSPGWASYFGDVNRALGGWGNGLTTSADLDFPSVSAGAQQPLTVAAKGARIGDTVVVQPLTFQAGITFQGYVISDDVVTVYASNITPGAINPAPNTFRIIILQN